jgi:hypothetical protein
MPTTSADANTAASVRPGDTIVCTDEAASPAVTAGVYGNMTVSRWEPDGQLTNIYHVPLAAIMAGWTGGAADCTQPLSWSADFSKFLLSATPPNQTGNHIVMIDARTGHLTDLTALRQKSGFSAAVLNETNPIFLSDHPTQNVTFGSRLIRFTDTNGSFELVNLNTPTIATTQPTVTFDYHDAIAGHPEQQLSGSSAPGNIVSPDGILVVPLDGQVVSIAKPATPSAETLVNCPNMPAVSLNPPTLLGWVSTSQIVITNAQQADLVSVAGGTPGACTPLIPATAKQISQIELSPDRSHIVFDATDTTGPRTYSVDVSGKPQDPQPAQHAVLSADSSVYRPGNY